MLINIILVIIIAITGMLLLNYNGFVKLGNGIKQTESNIDVLLNQRFELLPNLVETVKGYAKHETSTFTEITRLRSEYENTNFSVSETKQIDESFGKVIAIAENYPELKANENFLELQKRLSEIEDGLNIARLQYNRVVTAYNNKVESVPSNIVAKMFGFANKDLFKIDDTKRENVKVKL